jgi:hypothetical protein
MEFGFDLIGVVFPGFAFWAGESKEQDFDVKFGALAVKARGSLRKRV